MVVGGVKILSPFKFCPRCASPDILSHLEHGIQCKSCDLIYFHNTAAGVAAIIEIEDKILLLKRSHDPKKGYLDFPGGFVDYHESFEMALVREIREELNIEVCDIRYFGSWHNEYQYKDVAYFAADAYFVCKPKDLSTLKLSEENDSYVIIDPLKIDDAEMAFPPMVVMLNKYRASKKAKC